MLEKAEKVCAAVLKEVTPSERKRAEIAALARNLEARVASACKTVGVEAEVRVEGSMAKDTWLSEEPEIDIFMRVSPKIPRESLGEVCLRVARKATEGYKQVERFAEHPYLEAFVDRVRVNIVPSYSVERGEWLSATDRTPFHTDYINKELGKQFRSEVRLLKKFMQGIDVYGAEIKVGGFSGYLCELLVLYYEGFLNTLEAFAGSKGRIVVDIESYYRNRDDELRLLFREPLVVVDPVDRGRNVASAVQGQKLCSFVAASRAFLGNPDRRFFYPSETIALSVRELKQKLACAGSAVVMVTFGRVEAVSDVLWGQLYKSQRSLRKLVQLNGFGVLRDLAWSDEKEANMFLFELEQRMLPSVKKHLGPPLEKEVECKRFIEKYLNDAEVVLGPYIDDGRWVVEIRREYTDAVTLLNEKLRNGGKSAGVAEQISHVLKGGFRIFVNDEIVEIYEKNSEFAKFFTEFLSGRPKWLEAVEAQHD